MRLRERLRRCAAEARDLFELVLLPGLAAVLPWPLCYRIFRWVSRFEGLYRERWEPALAAARKAGWVADETLWARHARIVALVDHADLYLVMSRSNRWLARHARRSGDWPAAGSAFIAFTFHWGCGFWALRDLAAHGLRAHPLVASLPETPRRFSMRDAYARLRNRQVARTLGGATIDVGRELRKVVSTLRGGEGLIAAIDVPPFGAASERVDFLGHAFEVPRAMYRIATERSLPAVVFVCGLDYRSGRRHIEVIPVEERSDPARQAQEVFAHLAERVARLPDAWHFWGGFEQFLAPSPQALPAESAAPLPDGILDVIVPVYADAERTRRCIESVLAARNRMPFELCVVADAPPDPAIVEYCRSLQGREGVRVLFNERNLGFVASANAGMRLHAERDVVLLNSDCEVADGWLDRLAACALRHPQAGTLTPFSNDATICSYPWAGWSGGLPGRLGLQALDALFAATHAGAVVELPVGVGSCLYIRRACLDQTGLFDEQAFGRGYGEECDFCLRASAHGWKHLLCAEVFVFHAGGASFGEEKAVRSAAAQAVLRERHPDYPQRVAAFVERDPVEPLRAAVDEARIRCGIDEALQVAQERAQERAYLKGWLHDTLRRLPS